MRLVVLEGELNLRDFVVEEGCKFFTLFFRYLRIFSGWLGGLLVDDVEELFWVVFGLV